MSETHANTIVHFPSKSSKTSKAKLYGTGMTSVEKREKRKKPKQAKDFHRSQDGSSPGGGRAGVTVGLVRLPGCGQHAVFELSRGHMDLCFIIVH